MCINLEDQVSKVGQEFEVIRPSLPKKQKVFDYEQSKININVEQTAVIGSQVPQEINAYASNIRLHYDIPSQVQQNKTMWLSPKTVQNHVSYLKRQFPFGLQQSDSFDRTIFILKIIKMNETWKNRQVKGTLNGLVNEIKNYIFKLKAESGRQSIPGYSYPFTFDSITHEELCWFVNFHNNQYIDSITEHSPDVYHNADDPFHNDEDGSVEGMEVEFNENDVPSSSNSSRSGDDSSESEYVIDELIDKFVKSAREKRTNMSIDRQEMVLLELFDILREAGAPMYTFDKLTDWAYRNSRDLVDNKPISRRLFFKSISKKTYGDKLSEAMKPIVETHRMPSTGAKMKLIRYSFKAQLASLLLNEDLMNEKNLLLNKDDPFKPLNSDSNPVLDDLNTGWWHPETTEEICLKDNEILLGIIFFIDAGKVTNRQSVEPVTFTLSIFNRLTRFKAEAWRTLAYIENLDNAMKNLKKKYNSKMKLEDYHYMLSVIFDEVKSLLGKDKGLKHTLTIGGVEYDVVFKVAVQNIMGDCMGLDKLCLFYGSNSLETSRMCRDCNVPPMLSDDPEFKCTFTKISQLVGLSKEGFKNMSIHALTNAMKDIYFGARQMCIYQCTPGEPLHAILLGLIKYLYEVFEKDIPKKTLRLINQIVNYYYSKFSRQSCKNMPSLAPFLSGINDCDMLGAKEQYARLFAIFIALNNREVIHSLSTQPRHRYDAEKKRSVQIDPMTLEDAIKWYRLVELTLIMYQWIMLPKHKKADVTPPSDSEESRGQKAIRRYMHKYRDLVKNRGGHGVKLLKFHQLLHYTKEILKDGSIQNIDTGRCESIAVTMYKRISIWTQRRQLLLTEQLAHRHLECITAEELGRTLSKRYFSHGRTFCQKETERESGLSGSRFTMKLTDSEDNEYSYLRKTLTISWKGVPVDASYHSLVFQNLTKRLFLNTGDGGCLTECSEVIGRTEFIHSDGTIFRAHPNYRNDGMWYDWCKIKWSKKGLPIPAKIIMFLDLSDCKLMDADAQDEMRNAIIEEINTLQQTRVNRRFANRERIDYLTTDKWAVIRSAYSADDSTEIHRNLNTNEKKYNIDSCLTHRVLLEDECRIVPLETISTSCYVLPGTYTESVEHCQEFFVVDDICHWGEEFLENNEE